MNIGQLRHKVTIQENAGSISDGGGNKTPNWVDVATVWANVRPINGQESIVFNRKEQQITHTVSIRYRANTKAKQRLLFNGRILEIQYITNVNEENKELRLNCLERG